MVAISLDLFEKLYIFIQSRQLLKFKNESHLQLRMNETYKLIETEKNNFYF